MQTWLPTSSGSGSERYVFLERLYYVTRIQGYVVRGAEPDAITSDEDPIM